MSINAISSVSLYEYYYQINNTKQKEESETAKELKKLGITPSDDETKNAAMLKEVQAQKAQEQEDGANAKETIKQQDRPWADIMSQLGLAFNNDPKDDIQDIKSALYNLVKGIDDDELLRDIKDLDDYVKSMYITYYGHDFDVKSVSKSLSRELGGIAAINRAGAF